MVDEIVQHFLEQYSATVLKLGAQMEAAGREDEHGKTLEVILRSEIELTPQTKGLIENGILPWIYDWQGQKYAVKVFYKI